MSSKIAEELTSLARLLRELSNSATKVAFSPPASFAGGPQPQGPPPGVDPAMIAAAGGMPPAGSMPGVPVPPPPGMQPPPPDGGQPQSGPPTQDAALPDQSQMSGSGVPPEFEQAIVQMADGMQMMANELSASKQQQADLQRRFEAAQQQSNKTIEELKLIVLRSADQAAQAKNRVDYFENLLKNNTPPPAPPPSASAPMTSAPFRL